MNKSRISVLEISATFFLILAQIWFVGRLLSPYTILPLGLMIVSWVLHKDTLQSLGLSKFEFKGFGPLWIIVAVGTVIVLIIGFLVNRSEIRESNLFVGLPLRFASYLVPALFQQIVLNGFFVNRIQSITDKQNLVICIAGILFCIIHAPNPVLLILTLIGGTISAYFFLRMRNVYPLAVAHAFLATVAYCVLPQLWHHGFRVGMEYYLFVPKPGDCCTPEFLKMFIS